MDSLNIDQTIWQIPSMLICQSHAWYNESIVEAPQKFLQSSQEYASGYSRRPEIWIILHLATFDVTH